LQFDNSAVSRRTPTARSSLVTTCPCGEPAAVVHAL
jgi:hypothetical protein